MHITLSAFVSFARIGATACIFVYHALGQLGLNNRGIDFISILIFCFLSGYLSYGCEVQPLKWFYKRIFSIMLPYWFIIIPAVIINRLVLYKDTTIVKDLITVFGGNLFLTNPIYVIGWYITFVLLLYIFLFINALFKKKIILRLFFWMFGFLYFGMLLGMQYYYIAFAIGFLSSQIIPPSKEEAVAAAQNNYINKLLFTLQSRCYAFFIVHGGVLLFLSYYLRLPGISLFLLGVVVSGIGTEILYMVTKPLIPKAVNTALHLTPVKLRSITG
ncbi:MAG: hypothetical protein MUO63_22720 [Desulfobulbaceae bacterium]|nr:hypothetical protein [Desulfobulbaceae bacterium]